MNGEKLKTFGSILRGIQALAMIYALTIGILWYVKGRMWFKEIILPFHGAVFLCLLILTALILVPLMVMKSTRPYSRLMMYQLAYFFGGIAWFYSANYCLNYLGKFWFIFGSCIVGIGLVPVAVIGSIIKGHWSFLGFFSLQLTAAVGCRFFADYAVSAEE